MEMEVMMMPVPATDFNFDSSACSSPYITAPSSPQRFGNFFFSAPTSPARVSSLIQQEQETSISKDDDVQDEDFEFNFSGQLDKTSSLSADELFDGGKIKPLKPTTTTQDSASVSVEKMQERGRERVSGSSSSRKGGTRSLSPMRVSDIIYEQEADEAKIFNSSSKSYGASFLSAISFSNKRKWKLKDFLLFRSASEGRASEPDPLRKYAVLSKKETITTDDVKNSSFRSSDSGSVSSRRRSLGSVSAHELHYTTNRAVAEEMKRKTFLPYRRGLLGCLGFNHGGATAGVHEISRGVGSLTRG